MEKFKSLWDYQQADLELENFEKQLKDTPTRKKLVKLQRFLQASQNKIAELENKAVVKQNLLSELDAQNKSLNEDMEDLGKDIGYYSECDDEELSQQEIARIVQESEKIYEAVVGMKKQLTKIKQEIEQSDKQVKELLQKMISAKNEYSVLREEHNKELAAGAGDVKALKQKLVEIEKTVPADLMEEYRRIKGFRPNPVAILKDNCCGGCRMQLPSSVETTLAVSDKPVICENCGRMLIL